MLEKKHLKRFVAGLLSSLLCATLILAPISCAVKTIIPPPIEEAQPSWDGNVQNSGVIDYVQNKGFLITPNPAARYTSLTEKYGQDMSPPIEKGEGLSAEGENYILTNQYMVHFITMSGKHKAQ